MNRNFPSQLKRSAKLLAARLATGLCGVLAALLLGFSWLDNQDTVSVYRLEISGLGHAVPLTIGEALAALGDCHLSASIAPRLTTVTLRVDLCGQFQFYYFRQHASRIA
ncbi:hypothetical protein [Undibacterium sp.]|jgi:hypothetical protein|uniref:hypothetical protein n=1 Tax=Undibacterium sp. TaxID=1914977 RepID=UPI002BAA1254|nr:hypothetical protein [Undibacterium sp.]HTD03670.1 hypothetical protein [Undibacterium sp.]